MRARNFLANVLTSPQNFVNLLIVFIAYVLRLEKVSGQPVIVDFEPVNICNFSCPYCPVTYYNTTKKNLNLEEFKAVLNKFPRALRIKLQGMGEPFLNKSLPEFINLTTARGVWCEVITNGSVVDGEKLGVIEQTENFQLTISIDAAEKATFEKIRLGGDFQEIVSNLGALAAKTKLNVAAWMVVSEDNKDQVEKVIKLLAEINVHTLGLQMVVVDYGKKELIPKTVGKRVSYENRDAYYKSLRTCAKRNGVRLNISDRLYTKRKPCLWPWVGVFVDVAGNIVPCCRIGDASIFNLGNIHEVGFGAIWNSPAYKGFRSRHKENNLPEFCKSCYR